MSSPRSVANAAQSKPVDSLDSIRPKPAKAELDACESTAVLSFGLLDRLARTVETALIDAHGSGKAAAIELGIDQSQLKRQLRLGTFDLRRAACGGDVFLAVLGEYLRDEFGHAKKSKQQLAKEQLPQLLKVMLELV